MQMELELPGLQRVQAATAPMKASTQEIGYAQAVNYDWWRYDEETTPELIWPQSVSVFDAMRRTDSQVASVLRAVNLPVRRTQWRIDPAGARPRVVKFVADDLGLPISGKAPAKPTARTKDKFSWQDHLRLALLELVYGHMYFEQVYTVNDAGTEAHLKKLAPRMPKTIERIDVAPDGGLISITQWWTKTDVRPQPIPVDRIVAYVNDREGGNWLGQSILRPAYKNWLIKDRLLRVQAQTIERNGMGIPLYKAQEGATGADMIAGKSMATSWRAGEAAGSSIPYGADLVLRGVEGTLPDADPAIRYHDEQIARAVLAHFLNLGTQTGSWALGATFADFFVFSLQTLAQQIADVTTQHVIEDLVDLNFGPAEPAPRLVFDEIGSQQAATAQALKLLVDSGVIHPDQVLEETSRQQYGLPPADPSTATAPPAGAAPAPTVPETTPSERPGSVAARSRRTVKAKFNSAEQRDGHGKWTGDGLGIVDELDLADRIHLHDGDRLGSTSRVQDDADEADLNWAVVSTREFGPEARIGITDPDESDDWSGDWESGHDTTALDTATTAKLRTNLAAAITQADTSAREAERAWKSGKAPTDPKLTGETPVAHGEALDGAGGSDLQWEISLTDSEPVSWQLRLTNNPAGDGITYEPKTARSLLKDFGRIEQEMRGMAGSPDVTAATARRRRPKAPVRARYNPAQKRDPDGEWGDGLPGTSLPELDMERFDLIDEAEGSFGTVQMGVDDAGDVRLAFHEGNDARAIDLAGDEFGDLTDVVRRLQGSRSTELPDDAESDGVYDDDRFGPDREHKVELLGNGIISITFGADDPDPWTLNLDPPDGDDDDAGAFLRAADEVDGELAGRVTAAGNRKNLHAKFNPAELREPGGEGGGRWVRSIFREVVHTGHGDIATRTDRTGTYVQFGDSTSGRLDERAVSHLADLLGEVGYDDHGRYRYPRTNSAATHAGGELVGFAQVRRPDHRTAELELLSNDSRMPLSAEEADSLGLALVRAGSAWRVDADSGQVDVWANDHNDAVLRVAVAGGDPAQVHLDGDEVDRLTAATERAAAGRTTTVQTSAGPVKIRRVSAADVTAEDAVVEMTSADGSWWVIWHAADGLSAFESLRTGLDRMEEWRSAGPVTAAAGVDTHPGGEELKHYWVYGDGAAKWSTWTELYDHLKTGKGISSAFAKRIAAAWFHLRYGYWPGDRRNVHAKFNPAELRDPGGEGAGRWVHGPSASDIIADPLKIADRLQLAPGERFRGSAKVGGSDGDLLMARIDGPDGPRLRIGGGGVDEDGHLDDAWLTDTENTIALNTTGVRQLQELLDGTVESGAGSVKRYYSDVRKAHREGLSPDRYPEAEEKIAEGAIKGIGGDVNWVLSREADWGPELPGIDAPGTGWVLGLKTESDSTAVAFDDFNLTTASRVGALRKALARLMDDGNVAASSAVDVEAAEWDDLIKALVQALAELAGEVQAAAESGFNEKHPRGSGGRFRSTVDKLKNAIQVHRSGGGKGDPFEGFDREQLRRAAKTRGITLGRGEDRDSIAKKLLADLGEPAKATEPKATEPKAPAKRAPRKKATPKAKPAVKTDEPAARGGIGGGRDLVPDLISEVRAGGGRHDRLQAEYGEYDVRDGVLTQLTRDQGYGLPAAGSVDDAVGGGGIELFRGARSHENGTTAEAQFAAMRDDPGFALGQGIYGNGIYFSVEERVAETFAGRNGIAEDPEAAAKFGPGATVRVSLNPGAKIVTLKKLEAERKRWLADNRASLPPKLEDWIFDNGRYAAMRGYDAIRIDNMDDGSQIHEPGRRPRQSKATQYIVINRGALTMEAG